MSITTFDYLAWLAGTVAIYWIVPKHRDLALAAGTVAFLLCYSPLSAAILAAFLTGTYIAATRWQVTGTSLIVSIIAMVGVLAYYKLEVMTGTSLLEEVIIPLGISYYTFRCIHYLLEQYKGALPAHGFREYAGYQLFLPTLMVGPIHRFGDYQRDLRRVRWDSRLFSEGLERILYGYFKIMVLGVFLVSEQLGGYADSLAGTQPWLETYLRMIARCLYGYLLFAGYSDVAIGFARLLGFRVMENFNWPFLRRNISEFWKSWHISLTSWVREYVYMSVIATSRKAWLAAIVTMLIIGLWHEFSYRYVLWGIWHGAGIAAWQLFQGAKPRLPSFTGLPRVITDGLSIVATFHFVVLSFVLVQEPELDQAAEVYRVLLTGWVDP